MCGIVVEFFTEGRADGSSCEMANMLHTIEHRGYDQISIREYENCKVGFRRLAITEADADQPQGGKWKVYLNGEIYNYQELGFSGNECSVISQGLEMFGPEWVRCLNGMFFIVAIKYDQVYIFRDRYGIKPVYYWQGDGVTVVASEAKAIAAHSEYKFGVNHSAQRQWFTFNNVLCDQTLFDKIYKFPAGTYWELQSNIATTYWDWKFQPDEHMEYDYAVKRVRELVQQAVRRQIPKDVPFAVSLSGGVDSNVIASQMPSGTRGFNIGFKDEAFNEFELTKHSPIPCIMSPLQCVLNFDETIYHLEDLRVGQSWQHYTLFQIMAQSGIVVAFDGAGADELFGGYEWRYSEPNYYSVVNRTGAFDPFCKSVFENKFPFDDLNSRYRFDARHFLEGVLLVVDKLSMAHTIEVRVPFLDNDLVDFALTIPPRFKFKKQVLKDAFRGIVAEEILNGPKRGFSCPDWLEGEGNAANKWAHAAFESWNKQFNPHYNEKQPV
jgi:asparagine synthase (glutamine-hydrolysing)